MNNWFLSVVLVLCVASPVFAQDMAGRAVLVVGQAYVSDSDGARRLLRKGDVVFSGETIATRRHSYVNIVYSDEGRTLIGPNSELRIQDYRYQAPKMAGPRKKVGATNEVGRSVFALLKGGFRAITGVIGRTRKESYSIQTQVATIGIRGTDAVYVDCSDGRCGDLGPGGNDDPNSVIIGVYDGGVTAVLEKGESLDIDPGEFVQATKFSFNRLAGMPGILLTMPMADPNTCE